MPVSLPSSLVELILLGPLDDRRQLQDSPILGDVWVAYAANPGKKLDLLITPYRGHSANDVATAIDEKLPAPGAKGDLYKIACLQGFVAVSLDFKELLKIVLPMTKWWADKKLEVVFAANAGDQAGSRTRELVTDEISNVFALARSLYDPGKDTKKRKNDNKNVDRLVKGGNGPGEKAKRLQEVPALYRLIALAGLVLWAGKNRLGKPTNKRQSEEIALRILEAIDEKWVVEELLRSGMLASRAESKTLIWQISKNRSAMPALLQSIPAVKADAARTLFKVNCKDIVWAVIDSGIDGNHVAFRGEDDSTRVVRSFDFTDFRRFVSLRNSNDDVRKGNVEELRKRKLLHNPDEVEIDDILKTLASDARSRGQIHWNRVEELVEIEPKTQPPTNHGTHVAGILGGCKKKSSNADGAADGMCPDISLYDFRVLGPSLQDTEFAIIAALQFIRYINERDNFLTIKGVNLSLSIPHDVRNYACGRTPICEECERLVGSGVVVVAAAGNHGYKNFETKDGNFESYAAFSITDPGNADSVITVGSTHRFWPHTYGVSFFSSRGPTGDGRMKPDLVAPGERIRAPVTGEDEWGDLDGTSMAAPHVSGAAAMLMARYSELIGQPRRIKQILCESATDLARERSFQGNGMLDVLRAFQSI